MASHSDIEQAIAAIQDRATFLRACRRVFRELQDFKTEISYAILLRRPELPSFDIEELQKAQNNINRADAVVNYFQARNQGRTLLVIIEILLDRSDLDIEKNWLQDLKDKSHFLTGAVIAPSPPPITLTETPSIGAIPVTPTAPVPAPLPEESIPDSLPTDAGQTPATSPPGDDPPPPNRRKPVFWLNLVLVALVTPLAMATLPALLVSLVAVLIPDVQSGQGIIGAVCGIPAIILALLGLSTKEVQEKVMQRGWLTIVLVSIIVILLAIGGYIFVQDSVTMNATETAVALAATESASQTIEASNNTTTAQAVNATAAASAVTEIANQTLAAQTSQAATASVLSASQTQVALNNTATAQVIDATATASAAAEVANQTLAAQTNQAATANAEQANKPKYSVITNLNDVSPGSSFIVTVTKGELDSEEELDPEEGKHISCKYSTGVFASGSPQIILVPNSYDSYVTIACYYDANYIGGKTVYTYNAFMDSDSDGFVNVVDICPQEYAPNSSDGCGTERVIANPSIVPPGGSFTVTVTTEQPGLIKCDYSTGGSAFDSPQTGFAPNAYNSSVSVACYADANYIGLTTVYTPSDPLFTDSDGDGFVDAHDVCVQEQAPFSIDGCVITNPKGMQNDLIDIVLPSPTAGIFATFRAQTSSNAPGDIFVLIAGVPYRLTTTPADENRPVIHVGGGAVEYFGAEIANELANNIWRHGYSYTNAPDLFFSDNRPELPLIGDTVINIGTLDQASSLAISPDNRYLLVPIKSGDQVNLHRLPISRLSVLDDVPLIENAKNPVFDEAGGLLLFERDNHIWLTTIGNLTAGEAINISAGAPDLAADARCFGASFGYGFEIYFTCTTPGGNPVVYRYNDLGELEDVENASDKCDQVAFKPDFPGYFVCTSGEEGAAFLFHESLSIGYELIYPGMEGLILSQFNWVRAPR